MPWSIFDPSQGGGDPAAVQWAAELLAQGGYPVTPGNLQFVYDWEKSEGSGGKFNPLNQGDDPSNPDLTTTGSQYGGGAADYASWDAGIQGSIDYLNMPAYAGVKASLLADNPGGAAQALWASPWAASHYGNGANWSTSALPGEPGAYTVSTSSPGSGAGTQAILTSSSWKTWLGQLATGGIFGIGGSAAVGGVTGTAIQDAKDIPGALNNITKVLGVFTADIDHLLSNLGQASMWIRILEVLGGAVALGLGVVLLARALGVSGAVAGVSSVLGMIPGPVGGVAKAETAGTATAARTVRPRPVPSIQYQETGARTERLRLTDAQRDRADRNRLAQQSSDTMGRLTREGRRQAGRLPDEDDLRAASAARARRENKQVYKRKMDTSDLRKRTA